jgi:hypothetical protein
MRSISILTILSIVFLVGCGARPKVPGPTSPTTKATPPKEEQSQWLTVSSDPADLQAARRLAEEQQAQAYEAVFQNLGKGYDDDSTLAILKSKQEDAVLRLHGEAENNAAMEGRLAAAALLVRLGYPAELRTLLRKVLETGTVEERTAALHSLNFGLLNHEAVKGDPELQELLLKQLKDPHAELVKAAIQICGGLEPPGVIDEFARLIQRPNAVDRERLGFWLGRLSPNSEHLKLVTEATRGLPTYWDITAIEYFAKSPELGVADAALQYLQAFVDRNIKQLAHAAGLSDERQNIEQAIDIIAQRGGADFGPWLEKLQDKPLSQYPKGSILRALARIYPEGAKDRLIAAMKDTKLRPFAAEGLGDCFAKTEDEAVVAKIVAAAKAELAADHLPLYIEALLKIGGSEAHKAALQLSERADPATRELVMWRTNGWTAESVMDRVVDSGLLDRSTSQHALAELNSGENADPERPLGIETVLLVAKRGLAFDVETGMVPCRHDKLVHTFAKCSGGEFDPQSVTEQWHQEKAGAEEPGGDYTLQFIVGERLYRARLRDLGDWYDVERVVATINQALADAEQPGRFAPLASQGQIAEFLFGPPTSLQQVAKEFHLPLSNDPNAAMQKGKEFEKRVLEKYKLGEE